MLKVYNTLTRQKEEFKSIEEGKVRFYQCGPTVYWTQHIGNMRAMVCADLIRRSLKYLGYDVSFVRNYTDVGHLLGDNAGDADTGEDRMDKGAKREGLEPREIANKYIKIFEEDIKALNIIPATHTPRATHYVPQIIEMVQELVGKGFAYVTPKAVYFDVSKAKDYNRLNKQNLEENREGAGSGDVQDSEKKNPHDFALWFFKTGVHKDALQTWDSPWGEGLPAGRQGFPGWHIECSAMIKTLLGDTIDIHMGGIEHIPIHHTNEIAQSEAVNGVPLANYWIHNEHLLVNDKKMAKSEGTGYALSEVIEKGYDPLDLRYFFLQAHYKSKQNFTWEALDAARTARGRLQSVVGGLSQNKGDNVDEQKIEKYEDYRVQFEEALSDDFNVSQALAVLWEALKSNLASQDKLDLATNFDEVSGLSLDQRQDIQGVRDIPEGVLELVDKRGRLRKEGKFEEADGVRGEIEEMGYLVKDTAEGPSVKRKT